MKTEEIEKNLEEWYPTAINDLTEAVEQAITISQAIAVRKASTRQYWASVLLTKCCTFGISLLTLCPSSKLNRTGIYWDFGSVASLSRNIFELSLTLYYLAIEEVSEDEYEARILVMQLHDCMSRFRMFRDWGSEEEELKEFESIADELRREISKNKYFKRLQEKQKHKFLKGETPCMLIQDEILARMGMEPSSVRGYYRFLSAHTHSFPLGYYRMAEHDRGRGEENVVEKCYICTAAQFSTEYITKSTEGVKGLFSSEINFANTAQYDLDNLNLKAKLRQIESTSQRKIILPTIELPYENPLWGLRQEFE